MQDFIKKYRSILTFFGGLAVIAVIAFAFFYPDASEGNQLRQHDMQQGVAISHELMQHMEQTGQVSEAKISTRVKAREESQQTFFVDEGMEAAKRRLREIDVDTAIEALNQLKGGK